MARAAARPIFRAKGGLGPDGGLAGTGIRWGRPLPIAPFMPKDAGW